MTTSLRIRGKKGGVFSIDWIALSIAVAVTTASGVYSTVHSEDGGLIGLLLALVG